MLLFDMRKERSITEIGLAARTLKISGLDIDAELILKRNLFIHLR